MMVRKMSLLKRLIKNRTAWFFTLLFIFIFINNSSLLVKRTDKKPFLLAHRGLAQTFPMEGITGDTNTAAIIYEPEHPYLENTILSMEAAFKAGADMVELDIQLTKDGVFAVFHDAELGYRTDGKGSISEHTMEELKALDIGHGYTADNGKTYPFRGKGIGLMPTLNEVMEYFTDEAFLLHIKSGSAEEGLKLAQFLNSLSAKRLDKLAVYGANEPISVLKEKLPNLKVMSKQTIKDAFIPYILLGWSGYIPEQMKNSFFYLPEKYARFLWGWPNRFIKRIEDANSIFVLVAGDGEWSEGFDSKEDLKKLPKNYKGGIWTNRIDRIGSAY